MWKSLLFLLSVAGCASLGDTSRPLVSYKKDIAGTQIYQYELGGLTGRQDGTDGFVMINGENLDDGDFTYVQVFPSETFPGYNNKWDNFDFQYEICRVGYTYRGNPLTADFISGNGCHRGIVSQRVRDNIVSMDSIASFYVSKDRPGRQPSVEVHLNQCRDNRDRFFFTKLSIGSPSCPLGTSRDYTEPFYAYSPNGVACPEQKINTFGNIIQSKVMDSVFPTRLTLNCNIGFEVQGREEVDCRDGRWNDRLGSCQRVKCQTPNEPNNGRIDGRDYTYESSIRYSCNNGYDLVPKYSQTRNCEYNGRWNPYQEPRCERKSCGSPGDLIYGSMKSEEEKFGDVATYECDEGYLLVGNKERLCTAEGTWNGSVPSCQRITCSPLAQPSNGLHDGSGTSSFASGAVVYFRCHDGYKMDGAELLRCQLDDSKLRAEWSNEAPLCQPIVCKAPEVNSNVNIEGSDYSFGKTIKFRCRDGFQLQGSTIATCLAKGWDTEPPSCSARSCNNPGVPDNGARQGDNFDAYSTLTFSCNVGYELYPSDSVTIICLPNTRWNKPSPVCDPIKCPALPRLENGRMSTELFQYGQNITFECFPGYQLQGNTEIFCKSNEQWNRDMPQCIACPRNHYKSGVNQDTCKPCPVRSMTLSTATTSIDHCMCEEGSSKQRDGTCVAIRCVALTAPANGSVSECQPSSGSQCTFSCESGFILSGSRERRCLQTGWTGTPPVCTACPGNTYKAAEGSQTCIPCPVNSHTNAQIGKSLESCICRDGYTRASGAVGGCYDVNECLTDNGGCEDRCINTEGSFYCQCKKPGYEVNDDGKTCNKTRSCPTLDQSPANGKTICIYNEDQNGYICHFQCEPAFFFVSGLNDYVTCGQDTDFKWSHQLLNETAKLPACTEEFFVDTQIPITFDYTTDYTCDEVVGKRDEILKVIMDNVLKFPVCTKRIDGGCGLKYLVLNCSAQGGQTKVDVSFELYLKNPEEDEVGPTCDNNCIRLNMRQMLQDTLSLKDSFQAIVEDEQKKVLLEEVEDVEVFVVTTSFTYGRPRLLCVDEGEVYTKRRLCVPCGAGTYLAKTDAQMCTPCPIGSFQTKKGQTQCDKCLGGSTTASEGSDHPSLCSVRVTEIAGRGRKRRSLNTEPSMSQEEIDEILSFLD